MKWNQILRRQEYSLEDPDTTVIQFIKFLKKRRVKRVLDLGCGAGRHVVYLTKQGFETYGIDISETGLRKTKRRLRKEKLNATLIQCDMKTLPCVSHYFDAVIGLFTIYHNTKQGIKNAMAETHRTLRKGGPMLLNFQSKRSSKHGKGTRIEEDTFIQEDGPERGIIHHFVDEAELYELLRSFRILKIQLEEQEIEGYFQSRWIVLATKE
ncbi:MAG: class I SAM-dependent methyltransferase [Candidatus Bathyarchaeota archaeon]|nr:class I SAM-dependent methyltransferase [Candidatus Bathyarchaeota archaeon]MDH5732918.1 class I SAM-dependent methyltransferase [Candidatus Bathyarchaeota archaeon]